MNENYCLEDLIQHHLCVGKRLSAGVADSPLYKPGLFFVYIIVSDCIRKFCIQNEKLESYDLKRFSSNLIDPQHIRLENNV